MCKLLVIASIRHLHSLWDGTMDYLDPATHRFEQVYLLVDCNNFFCSCERLFRPDLDGRPLLVLSNNDGCVIARSYESKALGIPMGIAVFKIRRLIERHKIVCFSSNFSLYLDISKRVMSVLEHLCDHTEVYSVDEAFLCFHNITEKEAIEQAVKVRNAVSSMVGIQVGVGIARTKTLAKLANHHAKSNRNETYGVYSVLQDFDRMELLRNNTIDEIWGVGHRLNDKLQAEGIKTAWQLSMQNPADIKKRYNIVLMRTVNELNNIACVPDEANTNDSLQIMWSRSFTNRLTTLEELEQALTNFVAAASHKLRAQNKYARRITVFIRTSYFGNDPKYGADRSAELKIPTSDTRDINSVAQYLLKLIFVPGYKYNKAGVLLSDLRTNRNFQTDLLSETPDMDERQRSDNLMEAIDRINHGGHSRNIFFASQGIEKDKTFSNKNSLSPCYTTDWDDVPVIEQPRKTTATQKALPTPIGFN